MGLDSYTCFAYDGDTDLRRIPYWIFSVVETPPGHPRTPMFDWLCMNGSNWGAHYACDKLSMPSTRTIAFRSYNGYQLMTVVLANTDKDIKRRRDRYKNAIRDLIKNYDHVWSKAKARLIGHTKKPKNFDFERANWFELSQLFRDRIDAEREMYEIYYYFSMGLGAISAHFERVCYNMLGISSSDPLFHKLLAGFDNESYNVDRGLYALSMRADELGIRDIIQKNVPEDVISKLKETASGRQWVKEFIDFLNVHGWRCPLEMEYLSPSWVEEPAQAIVHLQKYIEKGGGFELDDILSKQAREREEVEATLVARIPVGQKDWFKALMESTQKYGVWNVEHVYYCHMYQYAITRYVLIGIGKRISQAGCINEPEDTLFLIPEEIHKALAAPEVCDLKPIVRMRRETWGKNKKIVPPPLLAKVSPEEIGKLILQSKDPVAEKLIMGNMSSSSEYTKADLVGDVSSPGIGEGPARVIYSADQLGEVQRGDILVVPAIWSSWSPVFSFVKGIVTDRGATLSSGALVGREYGIPVVSNVIEGTSKIKTGQLVRIDGNIGTVHIIDSLHGKRILIVDDEPDILDVLEELLPMCDVVKATTFNQAEGLLETEVFDIAILDIMGVDGYKLLNIANDKNVLAVMFTAHALTLEDTVKSYKKGAAYYIPKDEITNIGTFLNDVLEGKEQGKRFWWRWFDRFGPFYEMKFGPGWQNKYPEFWEIFGHENLLAEEIK
jgi:pyruvate,water dikinase